MSRYFRPIVKRPRPNAKRWYWIQIQRMDGEWSDQDAQRLDMWPTTNLKSARIKVALFRGSHPNTGIRIVRKVFFIKEVK